MTCGLCLNSRPLYIRDNLPVDESDNFLQFECHKLIKGYLYCKVLKKVFEFDKDDYCVFAESPFFPEEI